MVRALCDPTGSAPEAVCVRLLTDRQMECFTGWAQGRSHGERVLRWRPDSLTKLGALGPFLRVNQWSSKKHWVTARTRKMHFLQWNCSQREQACSWMVHHMLFLGFPRNVILTSQGNVCHTRYRKTPGDELQLYSKASDTWILAQCMILSVCKCSYHCMSNDNCDGDNSTLKFSSWE